MTATAIIPPLTAGIRPDIRVQLLSNPAHLCAVRELVGTLAKRSGFADAVASKVVLAVDEALANVMNHGYERRSDGLIDVMLYKSMSEGKLTSLRIVIEDEGKQTDPCNIKSRDLDDIRPGGLGVHIIKEVMDAVLYEKREQRGMRLTMIKDYVASDGAQSPCTCGARGIGPCTT
jgi:serine/threonine-protein kinase RsbW